MFGRSLAAVAQCVWFAVCLNDRYSTTRIGVPPFLRYGGTKIDIGHRYVRNGECTTGLTRNVTPPYRTTRWRTPLPQHPTTAPHVRGATPSHLDCSSMEGPPNETIIQCRDCGGWYHCCLGVRASEVKLNSFSFACDRSPYILASFPGRKIRPGTHCSHTRTIFRKISVT